MGVVEREFRHVGDRGETTAHLLYDQAIADCTVALEIISYNARAYWRRTQAYKKKSDTAKAKSRLNEAFRLDPTLAKPKSERAHSTADFEGGNSVSVWPNVLQI